MIFNFRFIRAISYFLLFLLIFTMSCEETNGNEKGLITQYPITKKNNVYDSYFDTKIEDPYRWLEDDRSPETEKWVIEQNKITNNYLGLIPYRDSLKDRVKNLWNYEKLSSPFKEGKYTYFYKNNGLQNQSVLYRHLNDESSKNAKVFLDPNSFKSDGTISLGNISFSKNSKFLAYSISEGGSDWRKIIVMDLKRNEVLKDTLVDVKFSGISWYKDEGFYYSSYDKPKGSVLSSKTDQHKLFYHKIGTNQSDDLLIYGMEKDQKNRYINASVTDNDRYLIISASISTSGNKLLFKDLLKPDSDFVSVIDNYNSDSYLLDNVGSTFYVVTNLDAPNQKIVSFEADAPDQMNWNDIIPEREHVLNPSSVGGYFFAEYMVDAISRVEQYDYQGNFIRNLKLPGIGSVNGFGGKRSDKIDFYSFTNYKTPPSIFSIDVETGVSKLYWQPKIDFNPNDYESKQVFYSSNDGTKIPMTITHKKGLKLNSKNPTILYGYGGFNISLNPSFSIANAVWLELGGVYAVANIRGGGEYGKKRHNSGTKMQKQNVFDDFISAAEYLIKEKITSSSFLALKGGSNGGLLVGAVMTQRPDLMKVALPAVGVLDMLRYHTFTAGAGWAYDYGTSQDSKEMFEYLLGYSPIHNIKKGNKYPATLITTGDHDDRVVPAHSFKFAAELQEKQSCNNPTLIRIETDAGHGAGTPVTKTIQQYADIIGFTLFNMGVNELQIK